MKKVNNICLLVVATSSFASVVSSAQAQSGGYAMDRPPTTSARIADRFTSLGLRLGGFVLNGSLGATAGYTSNAKYTQTNEQSDTVLIATPSLTLNSDWGRHGVNLGARATASRYSKFDKLNTTDWSLFANGRYDISGHTRLLGDLEVSRGTEGLGTNLSFANLLRPIRTNSASGVVTIETEFNRVRLRGTTSLRKLKYNHAALIGGGVDNQHARDIEFLTTTGRVDFAISPDTSVYVFGALERRRYDLRKDANSDGNIVAVGASFNFSSLITGEAEIGVMEQDYKQQKIKDNNSYYRANVVWSPTPLTTVSGRVGRESTEALVFGNRGLLRTTSSVTVDHELLRNVMLSGDVAYDKDEFRGIDRDDARSGVGAAVAYYLSNRVSIKSEIRHEKLDSSGADKFKSYKNNIVRVGLVLKY